MTSYTHSAVDNMLIKLLDHDLHKDGSGLSKVVRIDRYGNCHPQVREVLAQNVALRLETSQGNTDVSSTQPAAESLRRVMSAARVVGVSALTIPKSPLLVGEEFDVVIVDEAGQISQPAILGALMAASTFILVGDHMQLPPLAVSELSVEDGQLPCLALVFPILSLFSVRRLLLLHAPPLGRPTSGGSGSAESSVSHAPRYMPTE